MLKLFSVLASVNKQYPTYYHKGNRFLVSSQKKVRYNTVLQSAVLPLQKVLASISSHIELPYTMSTKMQLPEGDLHLQTEEENSDQIMKNIEQEIECPRCSDIMTLSSDFDKLGYICQECDLLLVMK
jgi:phage FluMu protein Com